MARKTIVMELPPRIIRIVFQDVEVINAAQLKSGQTNLGTAISRSDFSDS
jgi:hypothetical protein